MEANTRRTYLREGETRDAFTKRMYQELATRIDTISSSHPHRSSPEIFELIGDADQLLLTIEQAYVAGTIDQLLQDSTFLASLPDPVKAAVQQYRAGECEADLILIAAGMHYRDQWKRALEATAPKQSQTRRTSMTA